MVCDRKHFFAVYDKNDNLIFSLSDDKLIAKNINFQKELGMGEKLKIISNISGVGVYKKS